MKLSTLKLKKSNQCEFFGFTENHDYESIIIMHSCSTSIYLNNSLRSTDNGCIEKNLGQQPRSIMTKGGSIRAKSPRPYGNFDPGNDDKLMISYLRDRDIHYSLSGACGVVYEDKMHFFGGNDGWA